MLPNNKGNFNWEHLLIMTLKESSTPKNIKQGGTGKPGTVYNKYMYVKARKGCRFTPVSGLFSISPLIAYDLKDEYRCWFSLFFTILQTDKTILTIWKKIKILNKIYTNKRQKIWMYLSAIIEKIDR